MLFAPHHLLRDTSFPLEDSHDNLFYQEVNFDWLPKKPEHCDKVIRFGVICF